MVYTVTLNPALDCFIRLDAFLPGQVNRCRQAEFFPGGKGLNVSLLLHSLGAETTALAVAAGFTGLELASQIESAGCPCRFFHMDHGLTRINIKLLPDSQPETALNGSGPELPPDAAAWLERQVRTMAPGDFLVLAGSVPGGVPPDIYARLAKAAPAGVEVVADTSGPALLEAVKAGPFFIKPNLEELREALGESFAPSDAVRGAEALQKAGAKNVAVSMGGGGALLLTQDGRLLHSQALPGREASSVGAGDSFVAGFLYGWINSRDYEEALHWAAAAGAATAFTRGLAGGEDVKALYKRFFGK